MIKDKITTDELVNDLYSSLLSKDKSYLYLRGRVMSFKGGCVGCCLERVIRFCLEYRPEKGDIVSCSENCQPPFGGKMIFDGRDWRYEYQPGKKK